jgi:hypothetical protein
MQKFKVGDFVDEKGRIGQIVNIASVGTADVMFDDMPYPIRRQERDLTVVRKNPMPQKLKKVPSRIKETPRSNATNLYAIPERQSFPIGDLFHARLALTYVLSPSHYDSRAQVIQAVQDAYPEYNWAEWWQKKSKGTDLFSWDEYLNDYRMVDGQPRMVANPFLFEASARRSNPRKKTKVEPYDPTEAQFHAVVQGIYESLIKKYIGLKSSTPFKDEDGIRLDMKFLVPEEVIRESLGSAFAIATKQGQKQGTLKKGTQKATKKGKAKSKARAKDKAHLEENIFDYETTLMLARKGQEFRIVKRKGRFHVSPQDDFFNKKGYKTEASAKAAITRYQNALDDIEIPRAANPLPIPDKSEAAYRRTVRLAKRLTRASTTRKQPKSRSYVNTFIAKKNAVGEERIKQWRAELKADGKLSNEQIEAKIREKIDNWKIVPGKQLDPELRSVPIVAEVVLKYVYLPEMTNGGEPYILYRKAPIASYYTIRLVGPTYKFEYQFNNILDLKVWRSSVFGESPNLKADITRPRYDEEGNFLGSATGKKIQYTDVTYSPGIRLTTEAGFNRKAISSAMRSVIYGYKNWFEQDQIKDAMNTDDPKLTFPDDMYKPRYSTIECDDLKISTIDPYQHFGVFLRALTQLLEFKDALEFMGFPKYLDISPVVKWLKRRGILEQVENAIQGDRIRLRQSFTSERDEFAERYKGMSNNDIDKVGQYDIAVDEAFQPLFDFLKKSEPSQQLAKEEKSSLEAGLETVVQEVKDTLLQMYRDGDPTYDMRSIVSNRFNETKLMLIDKMNAEEIPPDVTSALANLQKYIGGKSRESVLNREQVQKKKFAKYATKEKDKTEDEDEGTKANPRRRRKRRR